MRPGRHCTSAGSLRKKSEDVSAYFTRNLSIVRQAEDMSMTDRVYWLLLGLRDELVAHCAVELLGVLSLLA